MSQQFYYCQCFLNRNYFSRELGLHLSFQGDFAWTAQSVERRILQVLSDKLGTAGAQEFLDTSGSDAVSRCVAELMSERRRREGEDSASCDREAAIASRYVYRHAGMFSLENLPQILDPRFLALVEVLTKAQESGATISLDQLDRFGLQPAIEPSDHSVLRLPVFTAPFCRDLLSELSNFRASASSGSCPDTGRPNTMNSEGVLLDELTPVRLWLDHLRRRYLQPLVRQLLGFPGLLDSHRAFTVLYRPGEDTGLGYHYDNSEATLNVCLTPGDSFRGNELYFGGTASSDGRSMLATSEELNSKFPAVKQEAGWGVLHPGLRMHGVRPLTGGRRENLIVWLRSSRAGRDQICPRCWQRPQVLPSARYGDGMMTSGSDTA